ncbi:MAG: CopG family transcriptional regulator [Acidobacteriota bacterium]
MSARTFWAVKKLADARGVTAGQVLTALAREALKPARTARSRHGVPLLPKRRAAPPKPTMALVNQLRDAG